MLSIQDLTTLLEMPDSTLRLWMQENIFAPDVPGGRGRNQGCRFTFMKTLGLLVAVRLYRDTPRGCVLSYVGNIVSAFAGVNEAWLEAQFSEGRTHFLMVHQGKPWLDGDLHKDRVNVVKALADLRRFLEQRR